MKNVLITKKVAMAISKKIFLRPGRVTDRLKYYTLGDGDDAPNLRIQIFRILPPPLKNGASLNFMFAS